MTDTSYGDGGGSNDGGAGDADAPASDETPVPSGDEAPAPAPAAAKPRYKVKYRDVGDDGNEVEREEELELEKILAGYQNGRTSTARYQAAKREREQARAIADALRNKETRYQALKHIGVDYEAEAEELVAAKLRRAMMSPEERQRADHDAQLKEREQRIQEHEQRIQAERMDAATKHHQQQYAQQFTAALKGAGLPVNPKTIGHCAALMSSALENGFEMTTAELAEAVSAEYGGDVGGYVESLPDEVLLAKYPKLVERIRKADIARLQGAPVATQPRKDNGQFKDNGQPKRKETNFEKLIGPLPPR